MLVDERLAGLEVVASIRARFTHDPEGDLVASSELPTRELLASSLRLNAEMVRAFIPEDARAEFLDRVVERLVN